MRNKYLYITLLSVLALHAEAQGQKGTRQVPKLVVNITIDQLRSDYLELFAPTYGTDGFLRLMEQGAIFEQASYPFRNIDQASAISSVVSGTTPFYHTITGEQWIDRASLRPVTPTPSDLAVSTIGDELKIATNGRGKVFAIAPTKTIAELAGGHAPNNVYWNSYGRKKWTSADITTQALQSISQEALGQDSIPDLLLLTYEAGGQDQQTYQQLDQEIARLVSQTETQVGKGNTLYVITSTGYCEENSTNYKIYHIPSGTFYINRTANLLNMYFGGLWGSGKYVETYFKNQLYLNTQLLESKRITITDATQRAKEFLLQSAGVKSVDIHLFEAPFFPIIVFSSGIQSARVQAPVTVDRIAPSIAKAIRIRAPNASNALPLF